MIVPRYNEDNLILSDRTRANALGHVCVILVAGLLTELASTSTLELSVAGAIVFSSLVRFLMTKPRADDTPERARRWLWTFGGFILLTGFGWGSLCVAQFLSAGGIDRGAVYLLVSTAAIAAQGAGSLSSMKRLATAFVVLTLSPLPVVFALFGTTEYRPAVLIVFVYAGFLLIQIKVNARVLAHLREREQQYRTLVDATLECILIHRDGIILEVNPAFERLFGYEAREIVGTQIFLLVHPDDREENRRHAAQESENHRETRAIKKDGTVIAIEVRARMIEYRGETARVTCVQDISVKRAAEESLRESLDQRQRLSAEREAAAIEALRVRSEFLANMSHEIRTPLNAIIGLTDLLNDTPEGDVKRGYLRTLKSSGEGLLHLVNDVLDFSKLDSGRVELEDGPFNLTAVVEVQRDLIASRALAKKLELVSYVDPQLPALVRGDAGRLGQVLLNLMSNAIKFTETGRIDVRCVGVLGDKDQVRVRFEVQDTGVGVPHDLSHKLFRPFSQADGSMSRKFGGTGLGLSICKRLIDGMGGEIGFESRRPAGTLFWFELPLTIVDERPVTTIATAPAADVFAPARILVVEDNSTNQMLILAVLKRLGLQTHAVVNGVEALDVLRTETFDLILMDCQMPEMDGYEATRRIRESEAVNGGHVPIVALTANVMPEDRARCFDSGMDAFVPKPVKRDKLVAELSKYLKLGEDAGEKSA